MSSYIITYDLGSSSLKAALLDENAGILATAQHPLTTRFPKRGWAEQSTVEWWDAMRVCSKSLLEQTGTQANRISALSLSCQTCNAIPVGKDGEALTDAILWLDTRSSDIARRLVGGWPNIGGYGLIPAIRWLMLTNGAPNPVGKDPITKYLWLREERPEIWAKTATLCDAKDFLIGRMTGRQVTTPDCANLTWLMSPRSNDWSPAILKHVSLDRSLLPDIINATQKVADGLSPQAAADLGLAAGTPVIAGGSDLTAFSLAAGDLRDGSPHIYIGSSAWCAVHTSKSRVDARTSIGSIRAADPKRFLLVAAQESAGTAIQKIGEALLPGTAPADGAFTALAGQSPVGSNGVLVLPWMHGERTPVSAGNLRGTILNMGLDTSDKDIARAALEGIALNIFWAGQHVRRMGKVPAERPLRLLGGVAGNDIVAQSIADLFGMHVERMANPQWGGVLGAWVCAAAGTGLYSTLEDAAAMLPVDKEFAPDSQRGDILRRKFDLYKQAYKAVRPWYDKAAGA